MPKSDIITLGDVGVEVAIEYNATNLKMTQVSWILLAGYTARARIWYNNNLEIDRTIGGPSVGAESITANIKMVWVAVPELPGGGYYEPPPSVRWKINLQTIG